MRSIFCSLISVTIVHACVWDDVGNTAVLQTLLGSPRKHVCAACVGDIMHLQMPPQCATVDCLLADESIATAFNAYNRCILDELATQANDGDPQQPTRSHRPTSVPTQQPTHTHRPTSVPTHQPTRTHRPTSAPTEQTRRGTLVVWFMLVIAVGVYLHLVRR